MSILTWIKGLFEESDSNPPALPSTERKIGVWSVGPEYMEYFAAYSEQDLYEHYAEQVGEEQALEDFEHLFQVPDEDMDIQFEYIDEGVKIMTTWRELGLKCSHLPCQIATNYI